VGSYPEKRGKIKKQGEAGEECLTCRLQVISIEAAGRSKAIANPLKQKRPPEFGKPFIMII
jgi:hypothetical protein